MAEQLIVCGKPYRIRRLLGHGKGGYSYLADCDGQQVVVKQIHHEPCDYYAFGNKIESERRDYERLQAVGIRIPRMLAIDPQRWRFRRALSRAGPRHGGQSEGCRVEH